MFGGRKNSTIPNQSFLTLTRSESFNAVGRSTSSSMDVDEKMLNQMSQLIQQSSSFDEMPVVKREQSGNEVKYTHFETLQEALQIFIQSRPTDEQLLSDEDLIIERKLEVAKNLSTEIKKVENLIPSGLMAIDSSYKATHIKTFKQHCKKIFPGNRAIDEQPEQFLAPFLTIYKGQLEKLHSQLLSDNQLRNRITSNMNNSNNPLNALGSRPKSVRPVSQSGSRTDEIIFLTEKRKELNTLDLLVLKIVIAVERINYYTMGVILPRDQNLRQIPFFDATKNPLYDYQSCLKICSLIKQQIERLEQIERQIIATYSGNQQNRATISEAPKKSSYFSGLMNNIKEKLDYRENFLSEESIRRSLEIWQEFSDDKTQGPLQNVNINLQVKINSLAQNFAEHGHKVTLQLFCQPSKPHSVQTQITNVTNSWLFTEIPFAETLLKDDLILIIKVFKNHIFKGADVKNKQKVNPKSNDSMKLQFLKAYSIINLSDRFFEDKMKDGKPLDPAEIKFFQYDQAYTLELDYDKILGEIKNNQFKGQLDEDLTRKISLKLQFTLMSHITRNQLSLRLDQSQIIRERDFWERMVSQSQNLKLSERDSFKIYQQEIEKLNLKELQKEETTNELRISLNSLSVKDTTQKNYLIYRMQIFLIEKKSQSASTITFHDCIYSGGLTNKKMEESFQTPIQTIKKQIVHFRNEFYLRVPIAFKTRDLQNFRLVFFVYVPTDSEKVHSKITEAMIEQEPSRYTFYPFYFAKVSLLDSSTNQILGGNPSKESSLQLMKFNPGKYLEAQLDTENEIAPGMTIAVNFALISRQYSTNNGVNKIIEPVQELQIQEIVNCVELLQNNDLLIYHSRIIDCLLYLYNNTQVEKCEEVLRALIIVFKRFHTSDMLPYKPLIQDYSSRWRGDRDSDKKLLGRFTMMLEKIPLQIEEFFKRPIDKNDRGDIKAIEQKLTHLPAILSLTCRLFGREFQTQYASIREKITTYFMKWMPHDLCIYRPDLIESTNSNKAKTVCSKPALVVSQLESDIANLIRNVKTNNTIKVEVQIEEEEDDNPFGSKSDDDDDDFQFVGNRPSQTQRTTFHNQTNDFKDNDLHMGHLLKQVQEIKDTQSRFCLQIKKVIKDICSSLHNEATMDQDDKAFCAKLLKIIDIQKKESLNQAQKKELDQLIKEINEPFTTAIKNFPVKAQNRLQEYIDRRKGLRTVFWSTLQNNLMVLMNFIDRQFVFELFDDKLMLSKIRPVLDNVVETMIPQFDISTKTYGAFYKSQQEYISMMVKSDDQRIAQRDMFEMLVKEATSRYKILREAEDKEIEKQIKAKVLMLAEFLASDAIILLANEQVFNPLNEEKDEGSIQEILATKISLSVYNHLKQYKNQFKELKDTGSVSERVKDTTASELQYFFLFKMAIFEKKLFESRLNKGNSENRFSLLSQPQANLGRDMLNDMNSDQLFKSEESKDPRAIRPSMALNPLEGKKNTLNESFKMGLGAKKENNPQQQHYNRLDTLYMQFPSSNERRLCFFLNETEDVLSKYWELKENSQLLSVQELSRMKSQHVSLFSVLQLQHLSNLTTNSFQLLYTTRPGCLDRLVKQVRLISTGLEFQLEEFFFNIKKLQVIEQFCKNVIDTLCDSRNKKHISELQDKYTYKSIVSQIWVLQMTLLAEQAQVLYDFTAMGSVLKGPDSQFQQNVQDFTQRLQKHLQSQQLLWSNFKDIEDMILPDESLDIYSGIQTRIIAILQKDLDDLNLEVIDKVKLTNVLRPLALMFVQIDELTFKMSNGLSYRVFEQIERLLKEFVCHSSSTNKNMQTLKNKKKQICDQFCEEYTLAASQLMNKNDQFNQGIKERVFDIIQIKCLYLNVITHERDVKQEGNLFAQLISYYQLMMLLQDKNLAIAFKNNISVKYKQMIDNINKALLDAYTQDVEKAKQDPDHICQKQASQYKDQMKEVKAFMHYEDYISYKAALDKGLLKQVDKNDKQHVKALETTIDQAVSLLVPHKQGSKSSDNPPNQFFDIALRLLSEKRALQDTNYNFSNVIKTLEDQINQYQMYDKFDKKEVYCNYYRLKIDSFLPEDMQILDRLFVYRTPSGYNQEFIKHDLSVLLGNPKVAYSKECEIKPLQPLSSEIREKYNIQKNTKNLSETPEEAQCPTRFKTYFRQNFKKQFYVEQCPSLDPAGFDEEYVITIYEVMKNFPTMTMIQEVYRVFERRIPRVEIETWSVKKIIQEIKDVLTNQNKSGMSDFEFQGEKGKKKEALTLDDLIQKYITNDDVGGGLPKMLDLFFNERLAQSFNELANIKVKRAYLGLFKELEHWISELVKVVEVFALVGRNTELTKLAEERLEDRQKVLIARKKRYNLQQLQENF